jgi:hypothetical protein
VDEELESDLPYFLKFKNPFAKETLGDLSVIQTISNSTHI